MVIITSTSDFSFTVALRRLLTLNYDHGKIHQYVIEMKRTQTYVIMVFVDYLKGMHGYHSVTTHAVCSIYTKKMCVGKNTSSTKVSAIIGRQM